MLDHGWDIPGKSQHQGDQQSQDQANPGNGGKQACLEASVEHCREQESQDQDRPKVGHLNQGQGRHGYEQDAWNEVANSRQSQPAQEDAGTPFHLLTFPVDEPGQEDHQT